MHAFALDGDRTSYVDSARVAGTVKDRWSFDEHDGRLRVATSLGDPWSPSGTDVVVLAERSGKLVETGRVAGLGRGEQVKAVRWFDDAAVVVTFRQTDPLHTVDLSDPDRPRLVGTLHVPGFSSYLHPVGGGLLVGVGRDAHDGRAWTSAPRSRRSTCTTSPTYVGPTPCRWARPTCRPARTPGC